MAYTNSPLVSYTKISPNRTKNRNHAIDTITIHCVVGQCSVQTLGNVFAPPSRQASSNYGIGYDGKIGMYCEEKDRSWCSSNAENDHRAVTIEVASDTKEPYAFKDVVYQTLITLCVDICRRNGKTKLLWMGDKGKSLNYSPKADEMVITVHRWFANKSCPGDWLYARLGDLAAKVTAALGGSAPAAPAAGDSLYRVRKSWADAASQKGAFSNLDNAKRCADANPGYAVFDGDGKAVYSSAVKSGIPFMVKVSINDLNIRKGPGTNYARTQHIPAGVYTIVEVRSGKGSTAGWGRLKSNAGWISLDFVRRI